MEYRITAVVAKSTNVEQKKTQHGDGRRGKISPDRLSYLPDVGGERERRRIIIYNAALQELFIHTYIPSCFRATIKTTFFIFIFTFELFIAAVASIPTSILCIFFFVGQNRKLCHEFSPAYSQ